VLNGAIAYALFRGAKSIPFVGASSIVGDTVVTSFLLPFATCWIVTGAIRKRLAGGKLSVREEAPTGALASFFVARSRGARAALLGVAAGVLVAAPVLLALSLAGIEQLERDSFLWFKAAYAGGLAALVQPAVAWLALSPARADAA
jgi:hypothetical protein